MGIAFSGHSSLARYLIEVLSFQGSLPYQLIFCQDCELVNSSGDYTGSLSRHHSSNPLGVTNNFLTAVKPTTCTLINMVFNEEEFVGNPSVDELKKANVTVEQLKYIATNYDIPFTSQTRTPKLMSLILAHLGDHEEETDHHMESPTPMGSANPAITLEIERVKMQALQMKLEYEREAKALEREEKEREEERKERDRQHQLQVLQLQNLGSGTRTPNKMQITKILPLMPQFSDYDPEAFFREFESSATHFDLPKEDRIWLVKPKLNGKALAVLDRVEDNSDYEVVKSAILAAYAVTTEKYRQTFRNMNKTSG